MRSEIPLLLGIDLGTGGVRAMAVTPDGQVAAQARVPFDAQTLATQPDRHEQPPQAWWQAFGAAVLAAAGSVYNTWGDAVSRMVRIQRSFRPDERRSADYDRLFERFCGELRRRGYL